MMEAKPCPAGKCDAQLYSAGEFVFCPKCGEQNPNYRRTSATEGGHRDSPTTFTIAGKEPEIDAEAGVIKW